ncbi:MAG: hypothetical protein HY704_02150 [Gemmatimonadetes bacterium]|nr:hypothetical protein [Gemmatimonadota bacterium]
MVAALVILTIVALVAVDYFVLERRARPAAPVAIPLPGLVPLSASAERIPGGVFLQPTYTWSRIQEGGALFVGVHPLLLGLVGAPYRIDLPRRGERVEKGESLFRIGRGSRRLLVPSPVAGRISDLNPVVVGETSWQRLETTDGSWLCSIEPEDAEEEVPQWLLGERAVEWTKGQYRGIREHLLRVTAGTEIGTALADGGEIPVGILGTLDEAAWQGFQEAFLGP